MSKITPKSRIAIAGQRLLRVVLATEFPNFEPHSSYSASRDVAGHPLRDTTVAVGGVSCKKLRSRQLAVCPQSAACLWSLKKGNRTFVKQGDIEEL